MFGVLTSPSAFLHRPLIFVYPSYLVGCADFVQKDIRLDVAPFYILHFTFFYCI